MQEMKETWVQSLGREYPPIPPEGGNGYPLQYSCLESSMDRGAWLAKSRTQLSTQCMSTIWFHLLWSLSIPIPQTALVVQLIKNPCFYCKGHGV